MSDFLKNLKRYLESVPKEEILRAWEATAEFDGVGITVVEFFSERGCVVPKIVSSGSVKPMNNDFSPKFSSGFFVTNNYTGYAKFTKGCVFAS